MDYFLYFIVTDIKIISRDDIRDTEGLHLLYLYIDWLQNFSFVANIFLSHVLCASKRAENDYQLYCIN